MKRNIENSFNVTPLKSTKPIYSNINAKEGPYYDPYDIHIHNWTVGILRFPQDHREPSYDNTESMNSNVSRMYCTVCHELNYEDLNKTVLGPPCTDSRGDLVKAFKKDSEIFKNKNEIFERIDHTLYNEFSKIRSINENYSFKKKELPEKTKDIIYNSSLFMNNINTETTESLHNNEYEDIVLVLRDS